MEIDELKFSENGLIPAVVQDYYSKDVLMLAYMSKESLEITIKEKKTCFWSRSRQALWRKGESSGNVQHVVSIQADCDGDTLLVWVIKEGPACHLGNESCFAFPLVNYEAPPTFELDGLYQLLAKRNSQRPQGSYTSYLFNEGKEKILKKISEESGEVLIAAMKDSREETVYELADLCYHCLVLMVSQGISLEELRAELASRHVIDKKIKQESMK